jgi:hypothetical protein
MAIVCATNLSPESAEAANVAAALAARLGEPLLLLGILDGEPPGPMGRDAEAGVLQRLEAESARLRPVAGVVRPVLRSSTAAEEVLSDEECRHARWVVVAAEGWRTPAWRRASMPERLARHGCAPVLAVRREAALVDWLRGRRRLLVMAGVDPCSATSDAAVTFLREVRRTLHLSNVDVVEGRAETPPAHYRQAAAGVLSRAVWSGEDFPAIAPAWLAPSGRVYWMRSDPLAIGERAEPLRQIQAVRYQIGSDRLKTLEILELL